jgi:hypothetical protein
MNDADFTVDLNERQGPEFDISAELQKSYIDPTIEIPEPPVILTIDDLPVFTAGNISTTIGKAKSRKTFFVTGMICTVLRPGYISVPAPLTYCPRCTGMLGQYSSKGHRLTSG